MEDQYVGLTEEFLWVGGRRVLDWTLGGEQWKVGRWTEDRGLSLEIWGKPAPPSGRLIELKL